MSCCDEYGDCRQGRDCPARRRVINVARALAGYAIFLLCLTSAAAAIAVWLAQWGAA